MAGTSHDARKIYLEAGLHFLRLQGNTAGNLTLTTLDQQIASYSVTLPVGLFFRLWSSRDAYLAELFRWLCEKSLRQLEGRIAQVKSAEVEIACALHWWLFDSSMLALMKLGSVDDSTHDAMAEFMRQADKLLASLSLNRVQCLALWGLRLHIDTAGRAVAPELLRQILSR